VCQARLVVGVATGLRATTPTWDRMFELVDYEVEPDDPTRSVPNPARKALDQELRLARASFTKLQDRFGAMATGSGEDGLRRESWVSNSSPSSS